MAHPTSYFFGGSVAPEKLGNVLPTHFGDGALAHSRGWRSVLGGLFILLSKTTPTSGRETQFEASSDAQLVHVD